MSQHRYTYYRKFIQLRRAVEQVMRNLAVTFNIPYGFVFAGFIIGLFFIPMLTLLTFLVAWIYWLYPKPTRNFISTIQNLCQQTANSTTKEKLDPEHRNEKLSPHNQTQSASFESLIKKRETPVENPPFKKSPSSYKNLDPYTHKPKSFSTTQLIKHLEKTEQRVGSIEDFIATERFRLHCDLKKLERERNSYT